jgi:hypothetical protein
MFVEAHRGDKEKQVTEYSAVEHRKYITQWGAIKTKSGI